MNIFIYSYIHIFIYEYTELTVNAPTLLRVSLILLKCTQIQMYIKIAPVSFHQTAMPLCHLCHVRHTYSFIIRKQINKHSSLPRVINTTKHACPLPLTPRIARALTYMHIYNKKAAYTGIDVCKFILRRIYFEHLLKKKG